MRIKFYSVLSLLAFIIWMAGCRSASKLYQKGNYDEAVQVAAKKLQKAPNDEKLQSLLQDAYHFAVAEHENSIRGLSDRNDELKWEAMYNEYNNLQKMYLAISKSPYVFELIHPADYSSYLSTYADKAGDVRYQRGMRWMEVNDKQSFKNAYREFEVAYSLRPSDEKIRQMLNESYDAAVTRVMIMPVDDYDYRFSSFNYGSGNFDEGMARDLQYNSGNEFVKFYSSWDAQRQNIIPDEIVDMNFTHFNIGHMQENFYTRDVSKQIVIREIVYRPDSIVKEYGTVKGKLITTKRNLYSEGNLNIHIRTGNGHWLWNDNIHSSHTWSTEFTRYTGDERALSEEDKRLLDQSFQNAPNEEEIIRCIRQNIYQELLCRIRNHYSRY